VRNVVCGHCHATALEDATRCPHCGQALGPAETHVTARPSAAQAIQADVQVEYQPSLSPPAPEPPRERYANWDDFRANSPVVQKTLLELATRALPDMRTMPREPLPADLPPAADALGVPLASVLIGDDDARARRFVMMRDFAWLAVAVVVAALGLRLMRHAPQAMFIWVGALVIVALVRFIGWVYRSYAFLRGGASGPFEFFRRWNRPLASGRLWVFENGILWQDGAAIEACRLEDIDTFRAVRDDSQPRFTLVPRPGVTLLFTLRSSVAIMPLAEYLEIRMASAQLLPKLQRIVGGQRVRFGALALDAQGIAGPGIAAPWSQVVRVMGDRSLMFVECRDQPGWRSVRAGDVSCPLLLLSLAHILIDEAARLPAAATTAVN
jgi:hypothetical protein